MPAIEIDSHGLTVRCPAWRDVAGLIHGTTTHQALPQTRPQDFHLLLGRARVCGALPPLAAFGAEQVHGADVALIDKPLEKYPNLHGLTMNTRNRSGYFEATDAFICEIPNTLITIRTADCLPVFLLDAAGRRVGLAHCGWRGLLAGLAGLAARQMIDRGSAPDLLQAWLGPAIRAEHYEVGRELVGRFQDAFPEIPAERLSPDGLRLDLAVVARRQLEAAGLASANILDSGECTFSRPDRYHSYRRQGERAGRMLSFIGFHR